MKITEEWVSAGPLDALTRNGAKVVKGGIAVFYHEGQFYAVDNRCPHLGFPLHMGSLCDGILTCHWHHARFDVCSGGTLDPWADDVPAYRVEIVEGEVWVDPQPQRIHNADTYMERLRTGLRQNIGIVIAKAVVGLVEAGVPEAEVAREGIAFGTKYGNGWNAGLTILTAMTSILPRLDKTGKILALYHGLQQVARSSAGRGERFLLGPLPGGDVSFERLISWYRSCIEVRDTQGVERILQTAIHKGATREQLTEMMLLAVTDHFYLDGGHTLDFHNKALEALAYAGPGEEERVLASLVPLLRNPSRSEEQHPWKAPVNLVAPLNEVFAGLPAALPAASPLTAEQEEILLEALLGDDAPATVRLLADVLHAGGDPAQLAQLVALAAAERIVRFHTQNDFGDWVAVLHTFTYAHAAHACLRRSAHPLLARAVFHGAAAVYLDRFLNVPAASRPADAPPVDTAKPEALLAILDQRQQVNEAARFVTGYLAADGDRPALLNVLAHALLREDADFHTFQLVEAAFAEYDWWEARQDGFAARARETLLLAATRYLAAHAPTARETPHTARIAQRLHRGDKLFEEE